MKNKPYLTLYEDGKVFTFETKNNKILQYLSEDDALFVSCSIYSDLSHSLEISNINDRKIVEGIVYIGEQYALLILEKGREARDKAEQFLIDNLELVSFSLEEKTLNNLLFSFKGINVIINMSLKKDVNFKKKYCLGLLERFNARLIISNSKIS